MVTLVQSAKKTPLPSPVGQRLSNVKLMMAAEMTITATAPAGLRVSPAKINAAVATRIGAVPREIG